MLFNNGGPFSIPTLLCLKSLLIEMNKYQDSEFAMPPCSGNNNNNPRKRGREVAAANTTTTTSITAAPMNHYSISMQSQQTPQLINLSQLHNHHQPNVVSTGLRLSFGDQQQRQQQQQQQLQQTPHHHHQQQQQQQNIMCQSPSLLSFLSDDLASPIKRQRDELDQFLQAQVPIHFFL